MNRILFLSAVVGSLFLNSCKENPEDPISTLSVSPPSATVPNLEDEMVFYIDANAQWEVVYVSDWFSIVPLSGSGAGEITVSYTSLPGTERDGNFVVNAAGHEPATVTVPFSQAAEAGLKVTPVYLEIPAKFDSQVIRVTASGEWNVSEDLDWVRLSRSSGDGMGTFLLEFTENFSDTPRSGNIVVSASDHFPESISIFVLQSRVLPKLIVIPSERDVAADSEGAPFTVTAEGSWQAYPDADERWIRDIVYESNYFRVLYSVNEGAERSVDITVIADGHDPREVQVTLTQAGNLGEPPEPPENLSTTKVYWDEINLLWSDESDFETGFRVMRRSTGQNWEIIDEIGPNNNSYSDTNLRSRTIYTYHVLAFNDAGESQPTNDLSVVTHSPVISGRLDNLPISGDIEWPGDSDWFSYKVDTESSYEFFTELTEPGLEDSRIWLYGPDSRTALMDSDDNSGFGNASLIRDDLRVGIHYIRVAPYDSSDTGTYTLTARAQ